MEGFDADLAKLLAIYILGEPNVEIVPPATETREAMLQNDTVDVVFNTYTITPERAEQISFAGPYFESGLAVAVKSDNDEIKGIDDLDGKEVIVGANTPAVTAVPERVPTANVTAFATDPAAVQALLQGRGEAYVQDYTLLASNAANDPSLKVVGTPFTTEPYGIGLKHDDDEFKSFINDWLLAIQDERPLGRGLEDDPGHRDRFRRAHGAGDRLRSRFLIDAGAASRPARRTPLRPAHCASECS